MVIDLIQWIGQEQIINVVSGDVSVETSIHSAITKASHLLGGGIDVVINNAGVTHPGYFDHVRKKTVWLRQGLNLEREVERVRQIECTGKESWNLAGRMERLDLDKLTPFFRLKEVRSLLTKTLHPILKNP